MRRLGIIEASCYRKTIAHFFLVGMARQRDEIGLPLTGMEPIYGSQLSLSALRNFASNVGECGMQCLPHRSSQAGRGLSGADCTSKKPSDSDPCMMPRSVSRSEAAEELREQAASCRRLARRAATPRGLSALVAVADHFDADARRIDPSSERRT